MSKYIRPPEAEINAAREAFEKMLAEGKFADGITFKHTFSATKRKATVRFSEIAWQKMQGLIRENEKEVGWHGLAHRVGEYDDNLYEISDIIVYPQIVSSANIDPDDNEYREWILGLAPEVRQQLRCHGHSHVNMSVAPSSTDKNYYASIIEQIYGDMFYIFMIWNKSQASNFWIYDLAKNILFEDSDIEISVNDDGLGVESFLADAEKLVRERKYTPPKTTKPSTTDSTFRATADYWEKKEKKQEKYSTSKNEKYQTLDEYYNGVYGGWWDDPYYETAYGR